jgi:hypothetical protein
MTTYEYFICDYPKNISSTNTDMCGHLSPIYILKEPWSKTLADQTLS